MDCARYRPRSNAPRPLRPGPLGRLPAGLLLALWLAGSAGCGGPAPTPLLVHATSGTVAMVGVWSVPTECTLASDGTYYRGKWVFVESTVYTSTVSFSTDATCAAASAAQGPETAWVAAVQGDQTAGWSDGTDPDVTSPNALAASVTASKLLLTEKSGLQQKAVHYVDDSATPNVLYMGTDPGGTTLDASGYPTYLNTAYGLQRN